MCIVSQGRGYVFPRLCFFACSRIWCGSVHRNLLCVICKLPLVTCFRPLILKKISPHTFARQLQETPCFSVCQIKLSPKSQLTFLFLFFFLPFDKQNRPLSALFFFMRGRRLGLALLFRSYVTMTKGIMFKKLSTLGSIPTKGGGEEEKEHLPQLALFN